MDNTVKHIVIPQLKMGDRLRVVRREYLGKLSQAEMAALLGVPRERYSQWESGGHEPKPADARQIAVFLERQTGVSAAWILGVKDSADALDDEGGGVMALRILELLGTVAKAA